MTKPNSTEIIFVVDRSGSMSNIASDMMGGFGTFIEEQKKIPGECRVTLTQFDDHFEEVYSGKLLAEVPPLELVPRGGTALLDAVGRTIDSVGARLAGTKEEDRPSKVIFVIITDGHENRSREYSRARIFEMIEKQKKQFSWDFIFMGADESAVAVAAGIGIASNRAVQYRARAGAEAKGVMRGLSANIGSARGGQDMGDLQASYEAATSQGPLGSNQQGNLGDLISKKGTP